jgi:hypothetical protein
VGGFIVLGDGRAFAPKNWIADRMIRAIAAELPAGDLHDWLLAQQSTQPPVFEARVDVRELTPVNSAAVLSAIHRVAANLDRGHDPYGLLPQGDDFPALFGLLAEMVDAAERGDPPMDLNPHMREVIPPTGERSGPGWDHQS